MTYKIRILWANVQTKDTKSLASAAILIAVLGVYLPGCIALWSLAELTGLVVFSWLNGLYATLLMGAAYMVMGGAK